MINFLIILAGILLLGYFVRWVEFSTFRVPPLHLLTSLSNVQAWRYRHKFWTWGRGSQIEFYLNPQADPELHTVPFLLQYVRITLPPSAHDEWFLASPNPSQNPDSEALRVLLLRGPIFCIPSQEQMTTALETMRKARLELFQKSSKSAIELSNLSHLPMSHSVSSLMQEIDKLERRDRWSTRVYLVFAVVFFFILLFKVF